MPYPIFSNCPPEFRANPKGEADIVIVGGGPVGLATAIQLACRGGKLTGRKIVVAEKNETYKRTDIRLSIKAESMAGLAKVDEELKQKVRKWSHGQVPISEIENTLLEKAQALGIVILKPEKIVPANLQEDFPKAKVFVGADGARSAMRSELLGGKLQFDNTHQHVINVQYKITDPNHKPHHGKLDASVQRVETYRRLKLTECLIIENRRLLDDGDFAVNLQIFIDEETYNNMRGATYGDPYYFDTDLDKVPDRLREILIKWWGSEASQIIQDPEKKNKMTAVKLGSFLSKIVYKVNDDGTVTAVVGDAAAAFPFFRAINNGLLNSTKLAKSIEEGFKTGSFAKPLKSYQKFAYRRAYRERITALVKSFFISLAPMD